MPINQLDRTPNRNTNTGKLEQCSASALKPRKHRSEGKKRSRGSAEAMGRGLADMDWEKKGRTREPMQDADLSLSQDVGKEVPAHFLKYLDYIA